MRSSHELNKFFYEDNTMTRRELRENVFLLLFRYEFHEEGEMTEQLGLLEEDLENVPAEDMEYINRKCQDIIAKVAEIDAAINESTTGWKTTRMGKVDLTILRLAVYEMKYEDGEVPIDVHPFIPTYADMFIHSWIVYKGTGDTNGKKKAYFDSCSV